eukprot:sb/3476394/
MEGHSIPDFRSPIWFHKESNRWALPTVQYTAAPVPRLTAAECCLQHWMLCRFNEPDRDARDRELSLSLSLSLYLSGDEIEKDVCRDLKFEGYVELDMIFLTSKFQVFIFSGTGDMRV